ncbi:HAMP domain-containing sensor histidine kinase [Actinotalea sp. Marseille-Q4924]|uniref:sensor histidine kinase n=1 Tax=Actinotalea sp. Marseille-Q4924 TaxID=2866571 RepID=UPI001CE4A9E4|nr:HAMP domain-containing sensor histidine kinase [Actinotalea sp. Marseille-Q4924]
MSTAVGDPPARAARARGLRSRAATAWSSLPLRSRLTALFTALLLLGLGLTGVVAQTFLRSSLVEQVDTQLASAAPLAVDRVTARGMRMLDTGNLPSDYHVAILDVDGQVVTAQAVDGAAAGSPTVPTLSAPQVADRAGRAFTVPDADDGGRWRALALPLTSHRQGGVVGSVVVALPLDPAEATLAQMRRVLVTIALGVVALGAAAGWWGVRRELRPLREIETTAGAIAAGDLARRVPEQPTSTEVGRLAAALNAMLAQLEQAFAAREASEERMRRFVSDASHELRTPLATIRGYGELYRMGALSAPDDVAATMHRIEGSAVRMGSLVEDLLHLARLDEDRPLRSEPVDLAVLATDAAADLRALDPDRPVRVEPLVAGGSTGGAVAVGDEDRLRQVLSNLVGNVARHTPPGTPAEVAVGRAADGHVAVEVRDHGPGVPPEHARQVFERFYRVDAARGRETGGAGLGLAIVAAIVRAHRGEVGVRTTPGGGTTVRVVLPSAVGHDRQEGWPAPV